MSIRRRRKTEDSSTNPHQCCNDSIEELVGIVDRYARGIEDIIRKHEPYPDSEAMRPGNSGNHVDFYCKKCRRVWPCNAVQEMRSLYGDATGVASAKREYEPLRLTIKEEG